MVATHVILGVGKIWEPTYLKPDEPTFNKPDTIDTPTYEKPNAYEDDLVDTPVDSHHDHPLIDYDTNEEYINDGEEPVNSTVVRYKSRKTKLAPPPTKTPLNTSALDHPDDRSRTPSPTSSMFQTPSLMTPASVTLGSVLPEDIILQPPSSATSSAFDSTLLLSPTTSLSSSLSQSTSSTAVPSKRLASLKHLPADMTRKFDIRKHALAKPHQHDIYFGNTKHLLYRKLQSHSYSWGFQNVLFRIVKDQASAAPSTLLSFSKPVYRQTKVAEIRRRAFQKDMTIEWGIDDLPETAVSNNESTGHLDVTTHPNSSTSSISTSSSDDPHGQCDKLENTSGCMFLFVYCTTFEKYTIRWRRPSLLSHDIYCLMRPAEMTKGGWQLVAEFDSHGMGYLINVGQLTMNKEVLEQVDRPDQLEAHLLVTCCTLVDLMREVVQKAVGLSNGGVANRG
ncbi:hypothetical protein DM01DRAFT_1384970 [Hesseltinella vesiculosa]|uniref:Uncharacterized protein n=1 Tax=Hesseltinella vesiculosa TaxID=101127 RepID=A0A1X2GB81_9FUNG|nr:hypothetical protein DM01DRAFT_1384970 [Hesseltinella vesiculosa]